MRKQKSLASSLLVLLALALTASSCRSQRDSNTNQSTTLETFASTPPFQTKEPERYRAKRTVTTIAPGGEQTVRTKLIAKIGQMRRDEEQLSAGRIVYLDLPTGRVVLIPDEKVYGEVSESTGASTDETTESSPDRMLHTEPITTSYQKLGEETINGRNVTKYRVLVNAPASGTVSNMETFVWVDEALGMPIRSETSMPDGTRSTMELTDISSEVDGQLFQIPRGYQKLDASELRRRLGKH